MRKKSKKSMNLDLQWSKEAQRVDEEWERAMNTRQKHSRLEEYIDFLEEIQPAIEEVHHVERCDRPFILI